LPREQRFGAYRRTLPRLRAHAAAAPLRRDASSRAPSFSDGGFWRVSHNSTCVRPKPESACVRAGSARAVKTRRQVQRNSSRRLGLGARALAVVSRGDGVASPSQSEVIFAKTQRRRRARRRVVRVLIDLMDLTEIFLKLICVALYFFYYNISGSHDSHRGRPPSSTVLLNR
jgi:hypothetical protein